MIGVSSSARRRVKGVDGAPAGAPPPSRGRTWHLDAPGCPPFDAAVGPATDGGSSQSGGAQAGTHVSEVALRMAGVVWRTALATKDVLSPATIPCRRWPALRVAATGRAVDSSSAKYSLPVQNGAAVGGASD